MGPNCAGNVAVWDCNESSLEFAPVSGTEMAYGFGVGSWNGWLEKFATQDNALAQFSRLQERYDFQVVDKLRIPLDFEGRYVLSWRWDAEQTPQVWGNCAVVQIRPPNQQTNGQT